MKKIVLIILLALFAFSTVYGQDYEGTLNNAPYKIRVPANWNGTLLMYAHGYGYLERWGGNQFDYSYADAAPGGAAMEDFLLAQGYALAGTVFSGTGWQVKDGTHELVSLAGLFNGVVGKPTRTILIGYSMGSLIALKSAEEVPLYDGVIAGCTVGAGLSKTVDLVGAVALAYHTLFTWPGSWGTWYDVGNGVKFFTDVYPVLFSQVMDPYNIPKFEFLRLFAGAPMEGFYQNPGWLFLGMFLATEVRADIEVRAKGPVTQNADHVYMLSPADRAYLTTYMGFSADQLDALLAAMNSQTSITIASPQKQYLQKYFDPSGDLQRPVLSMHEIGDGLVNPFGESVLRDTVSAAEKDSMLLQVYTNGAMHCAFTPAQLLSAVKAMDSWLDSGMKPGPEYFPEGAGFVPGYAPPAWPIGNK